MLLATMVSASRVTYQDLDGDVVTVTFSKSFLTTANVNTVFTFNTSSVNGSNVTPQRLNSINVSGLAAAAGTNITTSVARNTSTGGDGLATLGQIDATGRDLGNVTIQGDLGRIRAGDGNTATQGLGTLKVHSIGRLGTVTGAPNLTSVVKGRIASLNVTTDMKDASMQVEGGINGKLGSVLIGGSNIGGLIFSEGDMGAVRVLCDVVPGSSGNSGQIRTNGKLASVSISGSLTGRNIFSGAVISIGDMGPVKIGGNVTGRDSFSGQIQSYSKLASVTINGFLSGSGGEYSGSVLSFGDMGPVKVGGSVIGGIGVASGSIRTEGKLANVTIGGSLIGAAGVFSGSVFSFGDMGPLKIGGNVAGGEGGRSGHIRVDGKMASLTIGGSLIGNSGHASGAVESNGSLGNVSIVGSIHGDFGGQSGSIISTGSISSVTVGGSILGGRRDQSGAIIAGQEIASVKIDGSIVGGSNSTYSIELSYTGVLQARRIGTMTLGGSLIAGTYTFFGVVGNFLQNGAIISELDIGALTIHGSIIGNATNYARINARGQESPKGTTDLAIGKLTVNGRVELGRILAGVNRASVSANADAQIGPVVVRGNWIASDLVAGARAGADGHFGNGDDSKMSGAGVKDVGNVFSRIASITIGGQIIGTATAGDHYGFVAENIGSLKVNGANVPLTAGNGNDNRLLDPVFGDIRLREI